MDLFNKQLLERLGRRLLVEKKTIATAESVTAGLLQFAFSTVPDAAKPESGNKVFAYYAISYRSRLKANGKITAQKMDPTAVQVKFANFILVQLNKKM